MTLKTKCESIQPFTVTDAMSIIWKEEIDTPQLVRSDINKFFYHLSQQIKIAITQALIIDMTE